VSDQTKEIHRAVSACDVPFSFIPNISKFWMSIIVYNYVCVYIYNAICVSDRTKEIH
jgi:hypothetical protein